MGIFSPRPDGPRAGAESLAAEAALVSARAAALRIYEKVEANVSAHALLGSVSPDLKRARKVLLSQIHPGVHHGLTEADQKLLGLAANVVVTAYNLAVKQNVKLLAADVEERTAFADARRFAREALVWARQFAVQTPPAPTAVASVDAYMGTQKPAGSVVNSAPSAPVIVGVIDSAMRQAMNAGLHAALDAYAEAMALADPELAHTVDLKL